MGSLADQSEDRAVTFYRVHIRLDPGSWHRVEMQRDGRVTRVHLDGVAVLTVTRPRRGWLIALAIGGISLCLLRALGVL